MSKKPDRFFADMNQQLINFLRMRNFLKEERLAVDDEFFVGRYRGRDKDWLNKEVGSRWKAKIGKEEATPSFEGTLQNLQICCDLCDLTPNEVLLPDYSGCYFTKDDLEKLCKKIEENRSSVIKDLKGNDVISLPLSIPVACSFSNCTLLSLVIFIHNDVLWGKFICLNFFEIENYDHGKQFGDFGFHPEYKDSGSFQLKHVSRYSASYDAAYDKALELFRTQNSNYETYIYSTVYKLVREKLHIATNKITGDFFRIQARTGNIPEIPRSRNTKPSVQKNNVNDAIANAQAKANS